MMIPHARHMRLPGASKKVQEGNWDSSFLTPDLSFCARLDGRRGAWDRTIDADETVDNS